MKERRNDSIPSILADSLFMTLVAEGRFLSNITGLWDKDSIRVAVKPVSKFQEVLALSALSTGVKIYIFIHHPELRQNIVAYQSVVAFSMLMLRDAFGPRSKPNFDK